MKSNKMIGGSGETADGQTSGSVVASGPAGVVGVPVPGSQGKRSTGNRTRLQRCWMCGRALAWRVPFAGEAVARTDERCRNSSCKAHLELEVAREELDGVHASMDRMLQHCRGIAGGRGLDAFSVAESFGCGSGCVG